MHNENWDELGVTFTETMGGDGDAPPQGPAPPPPPPPPPTPREPDE